jgi:hypothetical protein
MEGVAWLIAPWSEAGSGNAHGVGAAVREGYYGDYEVSGSSDRMTPSLSAYT